MTDHPERTDALSALYQGEKADSTGIFNVAIALMGIGVAYLVGAIGTSDKYGSGALPWSVVLLLPVPLWLIAVFNSLMTLSSMSHGSSVLILEDALFIQSRLDKDLRGFVGSKAADQIMDIRESHPVHKLATVIVYGGVAAAVLLYTWWVIAQAWSHVPAWMQGTATIGYAFAAVLVALSWLAGFGKLNEVERVRQRVDGETTGGSRV